MMPMNLQDHIDVSFLFNGLSINLPLFTETVNCFFNSIQLSDIHHASINLYKKHSLLIEVATTLLVNFETEQTAIVSALYNIT